MIQVKLENNFIFAGGVRIARLLPQERALEFIEPRTGNTREKGRRVVVVSLDDLTGLCEQNGNNSGMF